jgi:hypothetical protein
MNVHRKREKVLVINIKQTTWSIITRVVLSIFIYNMASIKKIFGKERGKQRPIVNWVASYTKKLFKGNNMDQKFICLTKVNFNGGHYYFWNFCRLQALMQETNSSLFFLRMTEFPLRKPHISTKASPCHKKWYEKIVSLYAMPCN